MLKEAIDRILGLATPNQITYDGKLYVDKDLHVIAPKIPGTLQVTTLQGLVDLLQNELEDVKESEDLFVHVESPTVVSLVARKSDDYGRRQIFATATYPKDCPVFQFGTWFSTESFIIAVQQGFQRVMLERDDGSFAKDLDYVIRTASKISADSSAANEDDGVTQRVNVQSGVVLKAELPLQPRVALSPYRTFAEIDQVVSTFIFRARIGQQGGVQLTLFEGDGGRWRLAAVAAIKQWLAESIDKSPIIS